MLKKNIFILFCPLIFSFLLSENDSLSIKQDSTALSQNLYDQLLNESIFLLGEVIVSDITGDTINANFQFDNLFSALAQLEDLKPDDEFYRLKYREILAAAVEYYDNKSETINHSLTGFSTAVFKDKLDNYIYNQSLEDLVNVKGSVEIIEGHVPITYNEKVENIIGYYTKQGKYSIQLWLNREEKYKEIMLPILEEVGVPPEIFYVAMVESGLRTDARSFASAVGPWQFIQSTGRIFGLEKNYYIDERRDFIKSTRAAAEYLKKLYLEFDDWYLAFAAYNCGEGRVRETIKKRNSRDYWVLSEVDPTITGRYRKLPKETCNYVPRIMAIIFVAKDPGKYGFIVNSEPKLEWDNIEIDKFVTLDDISKCSGIDQKTLKLYNPELVSSEKSRKKITYIPVDSINSIYTFRMPLTCNLDFHEKFAKIPDQKHIEVQILVYKVKSGDSYWKLAINYQTTITAICELNNLDRNKPLRRGKTIKIPVGSKYKATKKQYYTVKYGDTLSDISEKYRTSVSSVKKWNGLKSTIIYPGQILVINK